MPSSTLCCRNRLAPEASPPQRAAAGRVRSALRGVAIALLLVALAALLLWLLPSQRVGNLLLGRIGASLGLQITVGGANELHLRGTPTLVLRDVVAREPGAPSPLFRASRVYVSLPWSTLRARGAVLDATRLELDAPVVDLPALQHWLATRPPTKEKRLPTLSAGLRVRDGSVLTEGWRIVDVAIDARRFAPTEPFDVRVRGRYVSAPVAMPMDLAVSLARPEVLLSKRATGFGVAGTLTVEHARDWRLPARVLLSGPLRIADTVSIAPARVGLAARYEGGTTRVPFALGLHGPLRIGDAIVLAPATLVLHGRGAPASDPVPRLRARAVLASQQRLVLQLRGTLAAWPPAWPALPAPLDASTAPLPFAMDYVGDSGFRDPMNLTLAREQTRFDGRFRLPDVLAWIDAADHGSPLPPLDGHLVTPRLDIGGAQLEGVEMKLGQDGGIDGR